MVERVGVVGCGLMGSGIAEVCARAGLPVTVHEVDEAARDTGRARVGQSLDRAVRAGTLDADARAEAWARLAFTTVVDDLAPCDLVIEAVVEDEATKRAVFAELDRVVTLPGALLASNTSAIPIMRLATATRRPGSVLGMHFFNPVPVLRLVELVPCALTSPETLARARAFAVEQLGKKVIECTDRAGFVVNALLIPYLLSAIRMLEAGVACAEDIDIGMVEGCAHPMGPLALIDLIGLDTTKAIADTLYAEYGEPAYAPPPLLARMVDEHRLGRKTGRGFYTYDR